VSPSALFSRLPRRARIALPDFSPETVERFQAEHGAWDEKRDRENLPTDFNDLHLAAGIEAVRAQMAAALQMPERQPEIAPASETPQPAAARNAAFSMSAANEKQAEQEQSMAQPPETPSQTPPHPEGSGIYAYASREQNGRHYAVFTGAFGKLFNYPVVPAEGAQTEQEAREAADQTITMHRNDDFIGTAWQSNKGQAEVYGWTNLPTFMPAKTGKEPQYGVRYENDGTAVLDVAFGQRIVLVRTRVAQGVPRSVRVADDRHRPRCARGVVEFDLERPGRLDVAHRARAREGHPNSL